MNKDIKSIYNISKLAEPPLKGSGAEVKSFMLRVRLTQSELLYLKTKAQAAGLSMSEYVRRLINAPAK